MNAPENPTRSPRKATGKPVAESYEAALQELETLMARIDGGQLPLDQLLGQYQRGAALLAYCREQLQAVEQQIKPDRGNTIKRSTRANAILDMTYDGQCVHRQNRQPTQQTN
jgi:exodeoxyribonuclease VII small subunit